MELSCLDVNKIHVESIISDGDCCVARCIYLLHRELTSLPRNNPEFFAVHHPYFDDFRQEEELRQKVEAEKKKEENDKYSLIKALDTPAAPASSLSWGGDLWADSQTSANGASATSTSANDAWPSGGGSSDWGNNAGSLWGESQSQPAWGSGISSDPFTDQNAFPDTKSNSPFSSSDQSLTKSQSPFASESKPQESNGIPAASLFANKLSPPRKKETTFSEEIATPTNQTRKVGIYEAQYDFSSRNDDELTFSADDKIKVCFSQRPLAQWPLAKLKTCIGYRWDIRTPDRVTVVTLNEPCVTRVNTEL